jgi:ribosomal protein S18 acetylase RimI-like enzyme
VRPASAADAPRLAEIARAAYGRYVERIGGPPRPMVDNYAELVDRGDVVVAEDGDRVVGLVLLESTEQGFLIDNLAVDPDRQGRGIGRALLAHAEDQARRAGHDSLYLYTHELMSENLKLYARLGYEEYDRRDHGGTTLVYMRKQLG